MTKIRDLKKFTWRDPVYIGGYFVIQMIVAIVGVGTAIVSARVAGKDMTTLANITEASSSALILIMTVSGLMTLGLAGMLYHKFIVSEIKAFAKNWKKLCLYILGGYILTLAVTSALELFIKIDVSENQQVIEKMLKNSSMGELILLQINIVFFAPIVEEFLLRKALFGSYKHHKIVGPIMLVVSSLIFAGMHYAGSGTLLSLLPYFVIAVAAAGMYWKTDNFIVPIGIHFVNNLIATILLNFLI
ncbi:MAG: lysostaphin resistance A-like protein [Culicoidibacterales bacterium]